MPKWTSTLTAARSSSSKRVAVMLETLHRDVQPIQQATVSRQLEGAALPCCALADDDVGPTSVRHCGLGSTERGQRCIRDFEVALSDELAMLDEEADHLSASSRKSAPLARKAARWAAFPCDDVQSYWMTISTRRFCGSRTPSAVGTRRPCSPRPITAIACAGTPSRTRASLTALARRSDSAML
jgi:hypothetical protein